MRYLSFTESECGKWIEGARKGQIPNINPEKIKQCDLCESIYHESVEGRSLKELYPVCAISDLWVKEWMMQHDSYRLCDPLSLDQSHYDDDDRLYQVAAESLVVPQDPEKVKDLKCAEFCCSE